ncbi:Smr/MutS family protein [Ferrovibrio sp.]|uniref:Smr/MutS family protein n=1 Tax=Ferrovibrio sp. TaxID=1917215 RepID=UPI0025C33771|nr:Smr/MutS family protein [Ferrovibrio sp.]MBX3454529.1 Smr/MutS family protein [Ferrovibrio sp.]
MPPKRSSLKPQPLIPGGAEPDGEIWRHVAAGAKPLRRDDIAPRPLSPLPKIHRPERPGPADYHRAEAGKRMPLPAHREKPLPQMDARLKQKLIRGELPIDRRLDLHGLTIAEAERAMDRMLREAVARGQRGLLVITGKGERPDHPQPIFERRGVLRHWLPDYLKRGPWRDHVLGIAPARRDLGGSGAYFVLLRRQRE